MQDVDHLCSALHRTCTRNTVASKLAHAHHHKCHKNRECVQPYHITRQPYRQQASSRGEGRATDDANGHPSGLFKSGREALVLRQSSSGSRSAKRAREPGFASSTYQRNWPLSVVGGQNRPHHALGARSNVGVVPRPNTHGGWLTARAKPTLSSPKS
mmetsp:Transcript_80928/g.112095  ORF Transcript_80928/g.112095 Transcript_80928/m.112095 type:complete len:157 (+) Transcript_80928:250-720(+)